MGRGTGPGPPRSKEVCGGADTVTGSATSLSHHVMPSRLCLWHSVSSRALSRVRAVGAARDGGFRPQGRGGKAPQVRGWRRGTEGSALGPGLNPWHQPGSPQLHQERSLCAPGVWGAPGPVCGGESERGREGREGPSPRERMGDAYLEGCLALFHQALHQVVLGLCQHLLDLPTALGQGDGAITQVVEYGPKVLPAAVDEDPACGR